MRVTISKHSWKSCQRLPRNNPGLLACWARLRPQRRACHHHGGYSRCDTSTRRHEDPLPHHPASCISISSAPSLPPARTWADGRSSSPATARCCARPAGSSTGHRSSPWAGPASAVAAARRSPSRPCPPWRARGCSGDAAAAARSAGEGRPRPCRRGYRPYSSDQIGGSFPAPGGYFVPALRAANYARL